MSKPRCLVAMSGGVDSSVAAALMQEAGYECAGVTMKLLPCTGKEGRQENTPLPTDSSHDVEDAERVCSQLGISHYRLDLEEEFLLQVIEPFVDAYTQGSTPNPCIECNRHLKFSALLAWAEQEGFDCLATGHYARMEGNGLEGARLYKAKDKDKDQSYVLYTLTSEQLEKLRFPLGVFHKEEVRLLAEELGFETAHKQESQDICFVPNGDYTSFIESYLQQRGKVLPKPGDIITTDGAVIGTHRGIHHYTIGQRRGLGVSGTEPIYVLSLDASRATVQVGTEKERGQHIVYLTDVNIIKPDMPEEGQSYTVKHRYRGREHLAQVFIQSGNTGKIVFSEKQSDLTKGQALVIYDGDCVLGGGTIVAAE